MTRIEAATRACREHSHAHDAARDGDIRRGEAGAVEHDEPLLLPALESAERARGDLGEIGVLVREDLAGGGHALEEARVALERPRHYLVAHEGPQVAGVGVRRVLAPSDATHAEETAELLVRVIKQRAHNAVAAARDGREPLHAGALDGMHEESLRAVVGRVGCEDARGGAGQARLLAQAVRQARRRSVAHLSRDVLNV